MEQWDLYDVNRQKLAKKAARGEVLPDGTYHLVVHVCVFNDQNQMLIQQRQSFKESWANMWDLTVGGSALAGESSSVAAERETKEEIGYDICLQNERPAFTIHFSRGFDEYYLVTANPRLDELRLQQEEVQAVKWASKDEILTMIDQGAFIPYHESLIEMMFVMLYCRDARQNRKKA
ncbi:MAG: NUDIX hydrolase [Bacilli bacterium]